MNLDANGNRNDGRSPNQLRPLVCVRSLLNRADGSARWSQGESSILAAVYGPRSITARREDAEKAAVEVIWKSNIGQPGKQEREYELLVKQTLENIILLTMHPRMGITVVIQVVHDDGSILACAINAAYAALVDAGIAMQGMLFGVSCGVFGGGREIILDLDKAEEKAAKAFVFLAFRSSPLRAGRAENSEGEVKEKDEGVATCVTKGAMSVEDFLSCVARGTAASQQLSLFFRRSLETYLRGMDDLTSSV